MPSSRRAKVTKVAGSRATVSNYGQTMRKRGKKAKKGKRSSTASSSTPTGNYSRFRRGGSYSRTKR